jgi:hypothetical protein
VTSGRCTRGQARWGIATHVHPEEVRQQRARSLAPPPRSATTTRVSGLNGTSQADWCPDAWAPVPYRWWDGQQWTASFTGTVSISGTDCDGVITLGAAFLRAGLTLWGFAGGPSCVPLIAAAVVVALVGLVAAIDLADVAGRIAHAHAGDAPSARRWESDPGLSSSERSHAWRSASSSCSWRTLSSHNARRHHAGGA